MDLDEFAYNPIIDDLIWVRESLGEVTRIVPIVASAEDVGFRFIGPSSLDHFRSQKPGWFAEWWSDATEILGREGVIEPLRELNAHERDLLRPAEEEARKRQQALLDEHEQLRVVRVILEAREVFWLKQYYRVVSLLTPCESVLGESDTRKLRYARRKITHDTKVEKN